ncbi:MAG: S-layer homology domain-containing protein [Clostridia bacterium]|nr:S-layer homology domain-containing protein [Clostridia bacterium]
MKKLISIVLVICVLTANITAMAETKEVEGLHEKLNAIILENNFSEEQIADMDAQFVEEFNRTWPGMLEGYKALGKMETDSDEEEYEYRLNYERPDFSCGVKVTLLSVKRNYVKQYADVNSFKYLFSKNEFWLVPVLEEYDLSGKLIAPTNETFYNTYSGTIIYSENVEVIKNEEYIKELLLEKNETKVEDIKIFSFQLTIPFLYIDCGENEYLMRFYEDQIWRDFLKPFEPYKLYPLKDVVNELSKGSKFIRQEKPTFENEAFSLQERGLLQGNENGLDLLKPLTRIEAATMLLRAMGESTESEASVQTFSDVPQSHWGYGAAENAYSLGLIQGVGNEMFAPDEPVTSTQFATMILRAGSYEEFNWEEALDILINEGILSEEDTTAMDLFTRGDMAKIIYESMEKGLF